MAQSELTSEQVAQYLIGNGLYLTGLEFLVEGQEVGGFDLTYLKSFFMNTGRFPPEELQKFQGEDALSNLLLAKEREQKLCLAEYELRVATEDLKQTKDQIQQQALTTGTTVENESPSPSSSPTIDSGIMSNLALRKHLNSVVAGYLLQCGYKIAAMTFQEEAKSDFGNDPVSEDTLVQYYRQSQEASHKATNFQFHSRTGSAIFSEGDFLVQEPVEDKKSVSRRGSFHSQSDRTPQEVDPPVFLYSTVPPPIDLIDVLTDSLPKIVPNILINKRSECIPLICSLVHNHPDPVKRTQLVGLLFNLIKKPDEEQRKMIIFGIQTLAQCIGSERTSLEIIPYCCDQIDHKSMDRRLLIAELVGDIAGSVEQEIGSSLLFSLIRQLSMDSEACIREALVQSLVSLMKCIPIPPHKQSLFEEVILAFIMDSSEEVSALARQQLIPQLIENQEEGLLSMAFIIKIVSEALAILEEEKSSAQNEAIDGSNSPSKLIIPKNSHQKKIISLLHFYVGLLPSFLFKLSMEVKVPPSQDPLDVGGKSQLQAWLDCLEKQKESNKELYCFLFQVIPTLLTIIQKIPPVKECLKVREQLSEAVKTTWKSFGNNLVKELIKALLVYGSGVKDKIPGNWAWVRSIHSRMIPPLQTDSSEDFCLLTTLCASIIAEENEKELHKFLRILCEEDGQPSWALQHPKVFIEMVMFCGSNPNVYQLLLKSFNRLYEERKESSRKGALLLAEALCLYASLSDLTQIFIPAITQMAEEKQKPSLQLQALSALQKIAVIYPTESEVIRMIYNIVEKMVISSTFKVKLAVLNVFSSAVSHHHPYAAFVLKQLPYFLQQFQNPELTVGQNLHDLALSIFNSLQVLEGVEILESELRSQLVTSMERLVSEGAPFLDNAQRQILASMLNDECSKIGRPGVSIGSSKGSSVKSFGSSNQKPTFSSDISCTSETPAL